jgi:hypothetical protein
MEIFFRQDPSTKSEGGFQKKFIGFDIDAHYLDIAAERTGTFVGRPTAAA